MDRNPAADLWRNTLERIPTVFCCLQYLGSLRDANTGEYRHFGLSQRFSEQEAGAAMRDSHFKLFADWLEFNLEKQKDELQEYLNGLEGDSKTIIENWIRSNSLQSCLPSGTREVERELYLTDLTTVLELLRYEYAVVLPDPDA